MSPELKQLQRKVQREFYKHRKCDKWKKLKRQLKAIKKKTLRKFYSTFVNELKETNPSKRCQMAKMIGALKQTEQDDLT